MSQKLMPIEIIRSFFVGKRHGYTTLVKYHLLADGSILVEGTEHYSGDGYGEDTPFYSIETKQYLKIVWDIDI